MISNKRVVGQYDHGINQRSWAFGNMTNLQTMRVPISTNGSFGSTTAKDYRGSQTLFDGNVRSCGFFFDAGTLELFVDGVKDTSVTKFYDASITTIHNATIPVSISSTLLYGDIRSPINADHSELIIIN